ncbi:MAG: hypothetical protein KDK24_19070 [Pseudooceanicola sp.]|nr:hypothetical protein [Pseudooceanicola sp.]
MEQEIKVRENKLRRMAERQGLRLCKSKRRDPMARDFGKYHIVDDRNVVIFGIGHDQFEATLDQVEDFLTEPRK